MIESICLGSPVIASKIGGVGDIIKDGVTGYLCNPNDVESFAEMIKKIYDNNDLLETLRKNCVRESQRFSKNSYLEFLIKEYNTLLQK